MGARWADGADGTRRSVALLDWLLRGVVLVTILVTVAVGAAGPGPDGRGHVGGTPRPQTTAGAA